MSNTGPQTEQIEVVINGESRGVPAGLNVASLLAALGIEGDRVAVELNRAIVAKRDWPGTPVSAGATLEIVQFVGGG